MYVVLNTLALESVLMYFSVIVFSSQWREWMEGPWGTMDPDKVDGETGNFWRALYKLEKQFSEVPNAQKIAARVSFSFLKVN